MKKKEGITSIFLIFLFLSILIFGLAKMGYIGGVVSLLETVILPVEKTFYSLKNIVFKDQSDEKLKKLEEENIIFVRKLADFQNIIKENNALKDQFQTSNPKSTNLLPAKIVGGMQEYLIVDKGKKDNVKNGLAVVFKDNLVGKVVKVSEKVSRIDIVTNKDFSFTAETSETLAQGIIKGDGEDQVLENVLLSEELKVSDLVLTKGDLDVNGVGFPQGLIAGKIISVDKKPSSLFQSAKVKSLINFKRLEMVFIVINN